MAEIYVGDFYSTIEEYVEKIVDKVDVRSNYYVVGDQMHECVHDITRKIYDRLCVEFENLCKKWENGTYDVNFRIDLFKIINDL